MQINKDAFIKPLTVLDLVPTRAGITASEIVKIDKGNGGLSLTLSSEVLGKVEVKASGKFPIKLPVYMDRRLLMPFVMASRDVKTNKDFEFSVQDKQLVLSHGSRKVMFNELPEVGGYGKININDHEGEVVKFSNKQKSLIKCATSCSAKDPSMPQLNCVYLTDKGVVMASNEISVFIGQAEKFKNSLPFPLFLLNIISHPDLQDIRFLKDKVILEFDCGLIMQTLPEKARKEFPTKRILKHGLSVENLPKVFSVSAAKLSESFKRFITYLDVVRRQDRVVVLEADKGSKFLRIKASTVHAKLLETVKMGFKVKEAISIEWPIDMVAPVIEWLGSQKETVDVHFDNESPFFIKNEIITLAVARKVKLKGRNYK